MKKKAFVTLTALTLLFAPIDSQACDVNSSCLGITTRIVRGIIRIIRDIYNFRHNNNTNDNQNIVPGGIINNIIDNIDYHHNDNGNFPIRPMRSNNNQ